mmetsp:Transcript_19160/g.49106  ORF Transcript_19160/g.49106 Transcript_19160/m.49106 type:complete len:306 (-) Transcript_19160:1709-2626(-)
MSFVVDGTPFTIPARVSLFAIFLPIPLLTAIFNSPPCSASVGLAFFSTVVPSNAGGLLSMRERSRLTTTNPSLSLRFTTLTYAFVALSSPGATSSTLHATACSREAPTGGTSVTGRAATRWCASARSPISCDEVERPDALRPLSCPCPPLPILTFSARLDRRSLYTLASSSSRTEGDCLAPSSEVVARAWRREGAGGPTKASSTTTTDSVRPSIFHCSPSASAVPVTSPSTASKLGTLSVPWLTPLFSASIITAAPTTPALCSEDGSPPSASTTACVKVKRDTSLPDRNADKDDRRILASFTTSL